MQITRDREGRIIAFSRTIGDITTELEGAAGAEVGFHLGLPVGDEIREARRILTLRWLERMYRAKHNGAYAWLAVGYCNQHQLDYPSWTKGYLNNVAWRLLSPERARRKSDPLELTGNRVGNHRDQLDRDRYLFAALQTLLFLRGEGLSDKKAYKIIGDWLGEKSGTIRKSWLAPLRGRLGIA